MKITVRSQYIRLSVVHLHKLLYAIISFRILIASIMIWLLKSFDFHFNFVTDSQDSIGMEHKLFLP